MKKEKKYLVTHYPHLVEEWDFEKNEGIDINKIRHGSDKKYWWKCQYGHPWEAIVLSRTKGSGCPYCTNKKIGYGNDLETVNPTLAKQWHPTLNGDLLPSMVAPSTGKKVWWKCEEGHEWDAVVNSRKSGHNCPYCSNQKIGYGNDLETKFPELAKQWHPTKNGKMKPSMVSIGSDKKYWWKCKFNHEWAASPAKRTTGRNCPRCFSKTSFPEQVIYYYFKKHFPDAVNTKKILIQEKKVEIDILIPSQKLGIEYDGVRFHKGKEQKDKDKTELLKESQGIKIIRFREKGLSNSLFSEEEVRTVKNEKELGMHLEEMLNSLGVESPNVDIQRDYTEIAELHRFADLKGNLKELHPEIAKQWHPKKNGNLKPEYYKAKSSKIVWWRCAKGHAWDAPISSRTCGGTGCAICSGYRIGYGNDLETKNPELAKQWHPTMNGDLLPSQVTTGSSKRIYWLCDKGHVWDAPVSGRTRGYGCPYCVNKKVGYGNDLATNCPELAKQWHPTLNGELLPKDFTPGSRKKAFWLCENNHEFSSIISSRARQGTGCRQCNSSRKNPQ